MSCSTPRPPRRFDDLRAALRAAPFLPDAGSTPFVFWWIIGPASALSLSMALFPVAVLAREGPVHPGALVLSLFALPGAAGVFLEWCVAPWCRRWLLDREGFRGESVTFRWADVERVELHLYDRTPVGDDEWAELVVRLEGGRTVLLHPATAAMALALARRVPPARREVR
jgi:hypothetical protein